MDVDAVHTNAYARFNRRIRIRSGLRFWLMGVDQLQGVIAGSKIEQEIDVLHGVVAYRVVDVLRGGVKHNVAVDLEVKRVGGSGGVVNVLTNAVGSGEVKLARSKLT